MSPAELHVEYSSPSSLLAEFTRCVGRGQSSIETRQSVAPGTTLVLKMGCAGSGESVLVTAEVLRAQPISHDLFLLTLQYTSDARGLSHIVQDVLSRKKEHELRRHVRMPMMIAATEDAPYSPQYLMQDLSPGGARFELQSPRLPPHVTRGTSVLLQFSNALGPDLLPGHVAWTQGPGEGATPAGLPTFGLAFAPLAETARNKLDRFLSFQSLPPPPWNARLRFS